MITLNLTLPTCWQEMTASQMRYVFFLLTQNYSADEVKTFCLIRFSGLQVLAKRIQAIAGEGLPLLSC
ncbi:MAG: hypothetical protein IJ650_03850 [Paludibacteraceae bacterium]|nr:hypothetical protein [Paludibacteraceae bacterium]